MNVEHLQLTRKIALTASGGAKDTETITLESGYPYRHLCMWVRVLGTGVINVSAQPLFGGVNDGYATAIADTDPVKVFQVTQEELRPATRGIQKHPDDPGVVEPLKSELQLTNGGAGAVQVNVFILAAATPGGS
jgi:hypothetical protein